MGKRAATIDIGTNTVLLLVAERTADGALVAVSEHATITRLGQGVDKTRRLAPEALARTLDCLAGYAAIVRDAGVAATDIVGTSAMRDAAGGEAIVARTEALFGVPARVLTGDEEAEVTFLGALAGLPAGAAGEAVTVFDIGGGSTEVVRAVPGLPASFSRSYDVGSVRLTERFPAADPPTPGDLRRVREAARAALIGLPRLEPGAPAIPVGIAGTVTTLAAVHLGLATYDSARVHGAELSLAQIEAVVAQLAGLPLAERRRVPGLAPERADVIVAGGLLVLSVLEGLGAASVRVSDRGVRWGLALRLL